MALAAEWRRPFRERSVHRKTSWEATREVWGRDDGY